MAQLGWVGGCQKQALHLIFIETEGRGVSQVLGHCPETQDHEALVVNSDDQKKPVVRLGPACWLTSVLLLKVKRFISSPNSNQKTGQGLEHPRSAFPRPPEKGASGNAGAKYLGQSQATRILYNHGGRGPAYTC